MIQDGIEMKGINQIKMQKQKEQQYFQLNKTKYSCSVPLKGLTCVHLFEDTLYLGTRNSKLYIFRIDGFDLVLGKVIIPHCEIVSSVTANSQIFVTIAESDEQMPVSIWDVKTKMFLTALKSHESQVSKAIFLSEPGWLATSSWDCTVRIWDLTNILDWEHKVKKLQSEYPVLTIEQVSSDVIAFGGDDCYINFWNWKSLQFLGRFFGHAGSVTLIYANLPFILTAGGDHKLKQWQFGGEIGSEQKIDNNSQIIGQRVAKMSRQIKKNYDSSIFLVRISESQIFLLDRHGYRFLHKFGKQFVPCNNDFQYNENITGMVNHGGRIYVTTTKGELKCYQIDMPIRGPQRNIN